MTPFVQIVTTCPNRDSAEQLAAALLEQRLAACVQMGDCRSWYHWQEKIEHDNEVVCTIKSRQDLFAAVCEVIGRVHPYETPEILALPIVAVGAAYGDWLQRELRPEEKEP
ncbi:MAG: divalent-cation tolerance protein CutA [Desulfobulbus sp.]|jgi:periplasmic divalent cation tolerance protein